MKVSIENIKTKYCLYARKSMEAEERQALSIDSQIKEMKLIAERDGLEVVCIKSEAHSAKNSGQREVFNEVIQDIKDRKYNSLLTWNTDRLSRNAGDLGQIVDLMDKGYLLEIRTFSQNFKNTPNDKFLLMILGSQAKLENDNKAINVQRGMRARVESGLWPGCPPTGYSNSPYKGHECEKIIDPETAPIIKEMFEKVAYEGYTNRQLFFWLQKTKLRTGTGQFVNMGTIHAILKRTFYYGEFEYPRNSGRWYKGKHEPIIDKKLFELTQEVLKSHSQIRSYKRTGKEPMTFSRFMKCGLCGSGIVAQEKFKKQRNGKIHRYVYYYCSDGTTHLCRRSYINEKKLLKIIPDIFDTVDIDLIGMKDKLNKEIEDCYGFDNFVNNITEPFIRDDLRKESDLRKYAKIAFEHGKPEEKREILKYLKGHLLLKDGQVYCESI